MTQFDEMSTSYCISINANVKKRIGRLRVNSLLWIAFFLFLEYIMISLLVYELSTFQIVAVCFMIAYLLIPIVIELFFYFTYN